MHGLLTYIDVHGLGFECLPRVSAKQSLYSVSTHTKRPKAKLILLVHVWISIYHPHPYHLDSNDFA